MLGLLLHPPACDALAVKLTETVITAPRGQQSPADAAYQLTSRVAGSLSGSRRPHWWPRLMPALIHSWKSNCNMAWSRGESRSSDGAAAPSEGWPGAGELLPTSRWGRSWAIVSSRMVRMLSRPTDVHDRRNIRFIFKQPSFFFGSVQLLLAKPSCVCLLALLPLMGSLIKCADGAHLQRGIDKRSPWLSVYVNWISTNPAHSRTPSIF